MTFITGGIGHTDMKVLKIRFPMLGKNELEGLNVKAKAAQTPVAGVTEANQSSSAETINQSSSAEAINQSSLAETTAQSLSAETATTSPATTTEN